MPAIPEELPAKTILAWRKFASSPEFDEGLDWLRRYHSPRAGGSSDVELVKSAIGWNAYCAALDDVADKLTFIEKPEQSADQPALKLPA